MSTIRINTGEVKRATSSLAASAACIEVVGSTLRIARGVASPIFAVASALSGNFGQADRLVREIENDIGRLTSTVNDIAASYEQTEMGLVRKLGGQVGSAGGAIGAGAFLNGGGRGVAGGLFAILFGGTTFGIAGIGSSRSLLKNLTSRASASSESSFKSSDKSVSAKWKGDASLYSADGAFKDGNWSGTGNATIGKVEADAEFYAGWGDDGPSLKAGLGGKVTAAEVSGNVDYDGGSVKFHGEGDVEVGTAEASAHASASRHGVKVDGALEVCAVKGTASATFDFFGLFDVTGEVTGKAGALGVTGSAGVDLDDMSASVKVGASAALGFDAGVTVKYKGPTLEDVGNLFNNLFR